MASLGVWIFGAGGHAKVVNDCLQASGITLLGWGDDSKTEFEGRHCLSRIELLVTPVAGLWVVAIGENSIRSELARWLLRNVDASFATIVHPSAIISSRVTLGVGTQIAPGVIVNTDSIVGEHVILNTRSVIEHDCRVGDGAHIGPGAILAGGVTIGSEAFLGAGSVVLPGVSVGSSSIVGAGAVVTRNVNPGETVVGVPAYPRPRSK
jgi:acetyltransferase EpsM